MRRSFLLLVCLILAAVGWPNASVAQDDEPRLGPPVRVEILPPPPGGLPLPGQTFAFTLRLTSGVAAEATEFEITSPRDPLGAIGGWDVISIGVAPGEAVSLVPMTPLDIPCELLANQPDAPIQVAFRFDGRLVKNTFSFVPRLGRSALVPISEFPGGVGEVQPDLPLPAASYARPQPVFPAREEPDPLKISPQESAEDAPRGGATPSSYTIRVTGRFQYQRLDGQLAGVDGAGIMVMDEDWEWDDILATTCTGPDGVFDVSFTYDQWESPDIYLELFAMNSAVVVTDASIWETTYSWTGSVRQDTDASFIDFGSFTISDQSLAPALHILTTTTRTWRWYVEVNPASIGIQSVQIQWPEDGVDPCQYTPLWELIEINSAAQWRETIIAHEYNHHWIHEYSDDEIDDYCNEPSRHDEDGDCGHGMWCQESAEDAWGEGFGQYVAASLVRKLEPYYGFEPCYTAPLDTLSRRNVDRIWRCDSPFVFDDPWQVEGNLAGLLLDMEDADKYDENGVFPGRDELALGHDEIVAVQLNQEPMNTYQFVQYFLSSYPSLKPQFWATALMNGFTGLDVSAPGIVTNLTSTSHAPYVESADHTAYFEWTAPVDDMSGINGYSILISPGAAAEPDTVMNYPAPLTDYISGNLGPGAWYFNIRAQDRAKRWSSQYVSYGPIVIRAPFSGDIRPWPDTGWAYGLVPRPAPDAASGSVPSPTSLTGNMESTYYSLGIQNIGEDDAAYGWNSNIYLDGEWIGSNTLPYNLGSGLFYKWLNQGPVTVRGGRHVLSVWTDSYEAHSEMDEFDNRFSKQWVWSPPTMTDSRAYVRSHPPDPRGGFLSLGTYAGSNCDGLRTAAATGSYYQAVTVWAEDDAADYDCRLYPQSTGPTNGFNVFQTAGNGSRPAGCLDVVFVRPGNVGSSVWDVGVVNMNDHWCDYRAIRNVSTTIATETPVDITLGQTTMLALRQFHVAETQPMTVRLKTNPDAGPLQVVWLDNTFATGDLLDYDGYAKTDATGLAEIAIPYAAAGWHCLAVFRDPKDIPGEGDLPVVIPYVLVFPTPCDLQPTVPSGWVNACVPRNDTAGTPTSVWAPSFLQGDSPATYINMAWSNVGPVAAPKYTLRTFLDGVENSYLDFTTLRPGDFDTYNGTVPLAIPAGRHQLAMRLDSEGALPEISDANNNFAMQWVWSPGELARRVPVVRAAPGDPTGGWADQPKAEGTVLNFNCDGVRLPAPAIISQHGYWQAAATMPGPGSDVDPRLHEVSLAATNGFSSPLVVSGWGLGQSDFVLVNYRAATPRAFDVGVIRCQGTEPYTVEAVSSTFIYAPTNGTYGPYNLAAQNIVNLHEVHLEAGPIAIGMHEVEGDVDWGLSLYSGDLAYQPKQLAPDRDGWISWMKPAGAGEWLILDLPAAGYYCLAVWKAGAADLAKSGRYELEFIADLSGIPDTPPITVTRLVGVHPNPFNPRATIEFDLAAPGRVQVSIYDLRGRRVSRLVDEERPMGHYECVWEGVDDRGQPLASGVYLIRLETAAGVDRRTATLVR